MEIKNEVTVKLSVEDLENIVINHLRTKGVEVKSVHFKVGSHETPGDYFSSMAPNHTLDGVVCKGDEIK